MMRLVVPVLAVLVFATLLILDPVALGQLFYSCATGHCGVRPRTLGLALAGLVAAWVCVKAIVRLRRPAPPPVPVRKPRARRPAAPKPAAPKPGPGGSAMTKRPTPRTPPRRKADA